MSFPSPYVYPVEPAPRAKPVSRQHAARTRANAQRDRILALLGPGPQKTDALAHALDVSGETLRGLLRTLRETNQVERVGGAWALTGLPAAPKKHVAPRLEVVDKRVRIVPARQIGVARDALVAALFGNGTRAA